MNKTLKYILKLILLGYLALLFNGELYAHSLTALVMPTLILMYIVYVLSMTIAINKFSFNSVKIFLAGSLIGLTLETFYSKSVFVHPILLGVNWFSVIIQFFYWGMAAMLPFYVYKQFKDKDKFDKNIVLNIAIIIYLVIEFVAGTLMNYPNTILIWIITGLPLGIIALATSLKNKDIPAL